MPLNVLAQGTEADDNTSVAASTISSDSRSSEAPLYPSRAMRDKSLIAVNLPDEAKWLETEQGKILALYRPTEAKKTLGVLILFHAAENPQVWLPMLENLRANLPRYGWETLAITLPQKYPTLVPERPNTSAGSASASSASETENENESIEKNTSASSADNATESSTGASSSVARDVLINAYVEAAFNFVKNNGNYNAVILADNSSVYHIMKTLLPQIKESNSDASTLDGPLQALMIANLQQQEPLTKQELEELFTSKHLPVLDIFFAPDNAQQNESRDLHKAVALRKKIVDYQQLLIENLSKMEEQNHQSFLVGRVRGFMKQKASGVEQKGRQDNPDDEKQ